MKTRANDTEPTPAELAPTDPGGKPATTDDADLSYPFGPDMGSEEHNALIRGLQPSVAPIFPNDADAFSTEHAPPRARTEPKLPPIVIREPTPLPEALEPQPVERRVPQGPTAVVGRRGSRIPVIGGAILACAVVIGIGVVLFSEPTHSTGASAVSSATAMVPHTPLVPSTSIAPTRTPSVVAAPPSTTPAAIDTTPPSPPPTAVRPASTSKPVVQGATARPLTTRPDVTPPTIPPQRPPSAPAPAPTPTTPPGFKGFPE